MFQGKNSKTQAKNSFEPWSIPAVMPYVFMFMASPLWSTLSQCEMYGFQPNEAFERRMADVVARCMLICNPTLLDDLAFHSNVNQRTALHNWLIHFATYPVKSGLFIC